MKHLRNWDPPSSFFFFFFFLLLILKHTVHELANGWFSWHPPSQWPRPHPLACIHSWTSSLTPTGEMLTLLKASRRGGYENLARETAQSKIRDITVYQDTHEVPATCFQSIFQFSLPGPISTFFSPTIQKFMSLDTKSFSSLLSLSDSCLGVLSSLPKPLAKYWIHKYNLFCKRNWCPSLKWLYFFTSQHEARYKEPVSGRHWWWLFTPSQTTRTLCSGVPGFCRAPLCGHACPTDLPYWHMLHPPGAWLSRDHCPEVARIQS